MRSSDIDCVGTSGLENLNAEARTRLKPKLGGEIRYELNPGGLAFR
jgi:hypothetical protein